VEVRQGVKAVRALRAGLVDLVYKLVREELNTGALVLVDPEITPGRLKEEWLLLRSAIRPEVVRRLSLVIARGDHYDGFPAPPGQELLRLLQQTVRRKVVPPGQSLTRPDYYSVVFKLLVHQWFSSRKLLAVETLRSQAGCSYPTVAHALHRLGRVVIRGSRRNVGLARFPREEWAKFVAVAERVRTTINFADRSGKPRAPEALAERLRKLNRPDIAVGGVLGARHYYADLDIAGSPRLDLSVHCPGTSVDLSFVEHLDPGLVRLDDPDQPVRLALHCVRHKVSLFERDQVGQQWADRVECLLDLHEARLEPQALEFLTHLSSHGATR
jgi:hypothetical protein